MRSEKGPRRRTRRNAAAGSGTGFRLLLTSFFSLLTCCSSGPVEIVRIPPGSTVRAAAESLVDHHVIRSSTWFRIRARLAHLNRNLKAGVYRLPQHSSTVPVIQALANGESERFRLTVPIGATIFDLARSAESTLGIPHDSVLAAARDPELLKRFDIPGPSAEGWLKPESFDFGGFDSAREVVSRFVAARVDGWDPAWDARARAAGLDRADVLTLASIVEGEAKDSSERPLIAAVYRNRLKRGMPLEADPTVIYAFLLRDGEHRNRLFNADYQIASPWNTYLHAGLPPGPVDNPSRQAIEAVLNPAKVPYLYFVSGPDGKSLFATTLAEHQRNVKKVRREK
ncbi:MAG: endolytic transglycosylase MltG [Gemmatimonadales bacterium]